MTTAEIYALARRVGFPSETARKMTAIAMKESSGNPRAFNGVGLDESYGLWQINMRGALGPARRAEFGLASNDDLYDPEINARIAYSLWGGNDANLERHWAIYTGPGAAAYARYLAALPAFEGSGSPGRSDQTSPDQVTWTSSDQIIGAIVGGALLYLLFG
jgi:hypothetical protein